MTLAYVGSELELFAAARNWKAYLKDRIGPWIAGDDHHRRYDARRLIALATTVLGFALVISIQALMMPILMAFMLLSNRASIQPAPISFAQGFVARRSNPALAKVSSDEGGGGDV